MGKKELSFTKQGKERPNKCQTKEKRPNNYQSGGKRNKQVLPQENKDQSTRQGKDDDQDKK